MHPMVAIKEIMAGATTQIEKDKVASGNNYKIDRKEWKPRGLPTKTNEARRRWQKMNDDGANSNEMERKGFKGSQTDLT
ncbi:hypothetical protein V6N12_067613 [Hibiscus sabdariffa]|uniref:Uncharacterized protein n=1 Tax=Hibiscus sabdariffa TaxID=183260 RepID=A0ABR2AJF6_9ROSI